MFQRGFENSGSWMGCLRPVILVLGKLKISHLGPCREFQARQQDTVLK